MKIAVTGTIGSGKSTLCRKLAELLPEFTVVSVDDIVRSIYNDVDFLQRLRQDFGVSSKNEASNLVFSNPEKRQALEQLSLRYIRPALAAALKTNNVIVEFPLLYEMSDFSTRADLVIAVGCDDATQLARVVARDKMSPEKLQAVRNVQYSRELRAALSDVYVDTGKDQHAQDLAYADIVKRVHIAQLKERALAFFGASGPAVWKAIETRYNEPQRHYHTLHHLHELFSRLQPHLAGHPHARAMELATWFHDLVYETDPAMYFTNEAKSAQEMLRLLAEHQPEWLTIDCIMHEQVYLSAEIIVATKTHKVTADWIRSKPDHRQAADLFIDADMSILAAAPARLAEYDSQIAQEWGQAAGQESFAFCTGRLNALRSFKTAGPVFLTREFYELESTAQANIDHLVDFWQQRVNMHTRQMVSIAQ